MSLSKNKKNNSKKVAEADYILRLYITGATHRSMLAVKNIKYICDNYLQGRYVLEIVDIYQQPLLAVKEQIIATPTLIRFEPRPPCRLVGDMSNTQKVLNGLDLAPLV